MYTTAIVWSIAVSKSRTNEQQMDTVQAQAEISRSPLGLVRTPLKLKHKYPLFGTDHKINLLPSVN